MQEKLTYDKAVAMLEKSYELAYVDYRDFIEDPEAVAQIISEGYMDCLDHWPDDAQWDGAREVMKETFDGYDVDEIEDMLMDAIRDRDESDPVGDVIKNTGKVAMFYKLGDETGGLGLEDEDMKIVLGLLKMKPEGENYETLRILLGNASYGGMVVLMFAADLIDFYGDGEGSHIAFDDPHIAIMDRYSGSGDFQQLKGTFSVPFDRERLRSDEAAPGYSLLGDVFGCSASDVDCGYRIVGEPEGTVLTTKGEAVDEKEKREIEFERRWREEKKCSFGDMKISRHANTPYRNHFPCGNKCTECGTFWID